MSEIDAEVVKLRADVAYWKGVAEGACSQRSDRWMRDYMRLAARFQQQRRTARNVAIFARAMAASADDNDHMRRDPRETRQEYLRRVIAWAQARLAELEARK